MVVQVRNINDFRGHVFCRGHPCFALPDRLGQPLFRVYRVSGVREGETEPSKTALKGTLCQATCQAARARFIALAGLFVAGEGDGRLASRS